MLKSFIHIILAIVMLISTMGMTVSKHYCGGNLVSVSLFENADDSSCCNMGDCCHEETRTYQVKEDFSIPAILTVPVLAELDILGHDLFTNEALTAPELETETSFFSEIPPLLPIQKALALKQVYRL